MLVLGNVDMYNNYISNVVVSDEGALPSDAKPGRLAFNNKRLYVCIEIVNSIPIWIPLTSELNTVTKIVSIPSTTWVFEHNLNSTTPMIQVYDDNQKQIIPDNIEATTNNVITITFGSPISGTMVAIFGDTNGTEKLPQSYERTIDTPTAAIVIQHNMGYNPTVVATSTNGDVILPKSVIHQSLFATYLEFTEPFLGILRFV